MSRREKTEERSQKSEVRRQKAEVPPKLGVRGQHPTPDTRHPKLGSPEPIAALNRVKILEQNRPWQEREPLVDVRVFCPEVVWAEHVCPYLRQTVAERVNRAQASLPAGYRLKAGTALRTLTMQKRGWDNYYQKMQTEHPEWPLSALRRATNKFFAPYDQKAPPGHCSGGAVDVGLLDPEGNSLDMIAPTEGWEAAYTWSDKISPEAKANRMTMVEAMLGAGFSNCRDEYWHYSWGDSAWAVRVGVQECPYGWIYPPVALEAESEEIEASSLQCETLRDASGQATQAAGSVHLPVSAATWRIGLYWANGVPVTLRLHNAPVNLTLFRSVDKETWEPITEGVWEADCLCLLLTPDTDRLFLSNALPVVEPKNA